MKNNSLSRKILMVDDDLDDQKYFVEAVTEIDDSLECVTAKDGQEALNLLSDPLTALPSCIFLDLRLPRVSGKQCLLAIKSDERLKHIPVVIYTTSRELDEADELEQLGAVHFISKPTDPDEIYYVLSIALQERWSDEDGETRL